MGWNNNKTVGVILTSCCLGGVCHNRAITYSAINAKVLTQPVDHKAHATSDHLFPQ
jgi:hypothetical protein